MGRILPTDFTGTGVLKNATVPACLLGGQQVHDRETLLSVDLEIDNGRLSNVLPAGSQAEAAHAVNLDGGLVLPTLVDMHTHLDKGHIWPRKSNPDGAFLSALTAVGEDREARWSAQDVRERMEFALKCAYAHGTSAIRTHLDSIPPQEDITWPVFEEVRQDWADRIELQAVCLFGIDRLSVDDAFLPAITNRVAAAKGILGAVTYMIDGPRHLS